ncbi:hypothetical protein LTR33_004519 [Friedmanniomyces endolithicus]|nr:hypothetical protein LTR33_004519 [Friedmanniomyces endolithicus]
MADPALSSAATSAALYFPHLYWEEEHCEDSYIDLTARDSRNMEVRHPTAIDERFFTPSPQRNTGAAIRQPRRTSSRIQDFKKVEGNSASTQTRPRIKMHNIGDVGRASSRSRACDESDDGDQKIPNYESACTLTANFRSRRMAGAQQTEKQEKKDQGSGEVVLEINPRRQHNMMEVPGQQASGSRKMTGIEEHWQSERVHHRLHSRCGLVKKSSKSEEEAWDAWAIGSDRGGITIFPLRIRNGRTRIADTTML